MMQANPIQLMRRRRSSEAGFTLLEMLVSTFIFSIVVGAIYLMLEVGRSDAFKTKQRTETMQNARVALNTIGRDAINAGVGFWKGGGRMPDGTLANLMFLPGETDGAQDWLTPVVPGNGVKTIMVDGAPVLTDAVTFVYQDNLFNNGRAVAVTAVAPATNTITVSPNNAAAVGGNLYVYIIDDGVGPAIASLTNIVGGNQLRFASGDPLGLNNPGGASTFALLNPAQGACKRITWVTYFVNADNVLVRRLYGQTATLVGAGVDNGGLGGIVPVGGGGGAGFVEMPLAYGIEDFQVKYVMVDGTTVDDIGATVDSEGVPIDRNVNRTNVRLVRIELKLRGSQIDPKTGEPVRVNLNGTFYTPNLVVEERPSGDGA